MKKISTKNIKALASHFWFKSLNYNYNLDEVNKSYSAIGFLAMVVIIFNLYSASATFESYEDSLILLNIETSNLSQTLEVLAAYTPTIEEDLEIVKSQLALNGIDGYLNKSQTTLTEASQLESEYLVQKSDTISGIAKKFNLHVATLVDRNGLGIEEMEKLQPGQKLIIPSKDTSTSQEWLVKLNEKKEQERKLAQQNEQKKKKELAVNKRTVTYRERSDSGYDGEDTSGWAQPISYRYISRGIQRGHTGIDMVADMGTPIYASKAGQVIEVTRGWGSGWGLSIVIDHGSGQTSRYAHMSDFEVSAGNNVGQRQLIGYSGNSGWSTGSHLHFEARINGRPFNPWK